ncbi:Annexin [Ancylostoma caninum]|uniref:Annexin n=1 Tax=Ancylostoma caninum TaxID=29170 RepID=A0A368GS53_ANCCA|nr:Annexin [Ancylostoma caninum]
MNFLKRLLTFLCAGRRDESSHTDKNNAIEDAHKLYSARKCRFGLENYFIDVFTSQSLKQLGILFEEYEKVAHQSIEAAIEQDFSGGFRDGLIAIVSVVRSKPAYFAKLLHKYIKAGNARNGSNCYKYECDIVRLLVSRSECDMADITAQYQVLYKKSVAEAIKKHFSGSYKRGLIALVNGNSSSAAKEIVLKL